MHHGSPHFPRDGAADHAESPRSLVAVAEAAPPAPGLRDAESEVATPASRGGHAGHGSPGNGSAVNGGSANGSLLNGNGVNGSSNGAANGRSARSTRAAEKASARRAATQTQDAGKLFKLSRRTQSLLGVQIVSCGSFAPEHAVSNQELEQQYGFEPGWVEQRTGILSRRYASPEMATSDLCVEAAQNAIRAAVEGGQRVDPADIDLVIVGTFTPDYLCPSTACLVQDRLGLDAPAVDLQAACSGFMYALSTGAQYVATGNSKLALVIGGDVMSRIVNPTDQRTAPLFGDGAGAVLLARGEPHQGLICYQMGSDGGGGLLLQRPAGGSKTALTAADVAAGRHFLQMDGRSVFKWAVRALTDTIDLVLAKSGMSVHDVSLFVLHQANQRIIAYATEQLGIPPHKVFNNLQRYGNTSAGSIPLALDEACREGRIDRGDILLMSGFGAGLSWGTALFRW